MPTKSPERQAAKTGRSRPAPRRPGATAAPQLDRRTQILQAAARLFAEFGYEVTSVRQIADAVNVQAGSLYHHFSSKEEILHEIVRDPLRDLVQHHAAIAMLPVDAELQFAAGIIMRFQEYVQHWEVHAILQADSNFFRRNKEFSYIEKGKVHAFRIQETILKDGMQSGLFHAGIDTYLMIGTIARMLSSSAEWFRTGDVRSAAKPMSYTFDSMVDFHLDCILRMVRTPERLGEPIPREAAEKLIQAERHD